MQNINEFVRAVTYSRKRTGIILLNDTELLGTLERCGLKLVNLAEMSLKKIILTDDELINLILNIAPEQPTLLLNLELFIAPRINDLKYLEYLLSKLIVKEPKIPVFMGFYSEPIFGFFRTHYVSQAATQTHIYEEY